MMNGYYSTVSVELEPSDKHDNYSLVANIILGVIQVLFGLLSIGLGVASICTLASGYFIGYGIWCGFLFFLTGIICLVAGCVRNTCMITTNMVFSLVSLVAAAIQFSIGILAAYTDQVGYRNNVILYPYGENNVFTQYDIFSRFNNPMNFMCAQSNTASWSNAWGPIDVLLLIVGALQGFTAAIAAIFCCRSICCGVRAIVGPAGVNYYQGTGSSGFLNEGYMTEPRLMTAEPPLYKVM